jgi:hypothetical protein
MAAVLRSGAQVLVETIQNTEKRLVKRGGQRINHVIFEPALYLLIEAIVVELLLRVHRALDSIGCRSHDFHRTELCFHARR